MGRAIRLLLIIYLLVRWDPLVSQLIDEGSYHHKVTTEVVLAIIAQESFGIPDILSSDGYNSVGLMQITPRPWVGTIEQLIDPEYNIRWGLWFLDKGLEYSDGNIYEALRIYNCGRRNIERNPDCGKFYADRVLYYWVPYIEGYLCKGTLCVGE